MYQGIVLNEYEMSYEEHVGKETHKEQTVARNPNDAILPDEQSNKTTKMVL